MAGLLLASLSASARQLALVGGTLIDGTGAPAVADATVLIDKGLIVAAGPRGRVAVAADAERINLRGKTVLPGLINTHVHFSTAGHNDYALWDREFPGARLRTDIFPAVALALLGSGVTTSRDLGGNIDDMLWLREQLRSGAMPGPRLLIAGPLLCTTHRKFSGGLKDPDKYWLVNGPEDARDKVRELKHRGVDFVKLWDDDFTPDEFSALISEAHANGLHVAAHLLTLEGIRRAVAAGMSQGDSLEHIGASAEDQFPAELVQTIATRGIFVTPTLIAFDGLWQIQQNPHVLDDPDGRSHLDPLLYARILDSLRTQDMRQNPIYHWAFELRTQRINKVRQLHEGGAVFALGTDSGSRANPHHESEWREMVLLHEQAGLTPMQVIEAATRHAAEALALADRLGSLQPGKLADVTVIEGDPLKQLSNLRRVTLVIQNGQLVHLPPSCPREQSCQIQ